MKHRKSRLQRSFEIPTASMADIAFLLIVFFMLTAVFTTTQGLRVEFPEDDPTQLDVQPEEAIHIKITGVDEFVVDRMPMSIEELGGYVQTRTQQVPDKPVIIHTNPDVPYRVMIDVLDLMQQLEVRNISIPTETEIERWRAFGVFE